MTGGTSSHVIRIPANFKPVKYYKVEELLAKFLSTNTGYGIKYSKNSKQNIKPLPYYAEPTWGDPDKLVTAISNIHNSKIVNCLNSALTSSVTTSIKHLQFVRNAAVHPSKGAMKCLNNDVAPYYRIRHINPSTPNTVYDLSYSKYLSNGDIAIERWASDIQSVCEQL